MTMRRTVILGAILWTSAISFLHARLNLGLIGAGTDARSRSGQPLRVGFLPVT
jgi:hypothetical protein